MSTSQIRLSAPIVVLADLLVEWDSEQNKLRVADVEDKTISVFSRGEVYRVAPNAPVGCVNIPETEDLPGLVRVLSKNHIVEVVATRRDDFNYSQTHVCRILI